jgi:hypothetical protein
MQLFAEQKRELENLVTEPLYTDFQIAASYMTNKNKNRLFGQFSSKKRLPDKIHIFSRHSRHSFTS